MKKTLEKLMAIMMVTVLSISCGGDDNNGVLNVPLNPTNYGSLQLLQGTWVGYTSDESNAIVVDFYDDMTGGYAQYYYNTYNNEYDKTKESTFRYSYNSSTGKITLSINGENLVWKVQSLSSEKIRFEDHKGYVYYGTRYHESDWAPSDVSGFHFVGGIYISDISGTLDFYFDSNTTLNAVSTIKAEINQYVANSASYQKTGTNKAKITFSYSLSGSLSGSKTATVYLTFYGDGFGGCFASEWGEGIGSDFTLKRESPSETPQAPYSVAYKKFSPSEKTWYQFGSQNGSEVNVTNFQLVVNTSCFNVTAAYTRNADNTATLTISEITNDTFKAPDSYFYTYTLTFTSSTEGNYSCYKSSTNRYDNGSTYSGRFKLE